ncbi:MAG: 5'(3')-deoxyribonucleotidase [Ferruginibacter sp.]|nr:5'(3')-deoxyribonucleotidase [Ferruginibacter sp.]
MKRIAVDMDGVLADVYSQFDRYYTEETGKVMKHEDTIGRPEGEAFPNALDYVNSPGFFRSAPLMAHGQRVLEKINQQYQLFIVSAAMEFPNSLGEKQAWLNEHFPFITWRQMVFCGSKDIIKADIMVDDHFRNLDVFTGTTYLFTQPHNQLRDPGIHTRVDDWLQLEKLLLS